MRMIAYAVLGLVLLLGAGWYGWQPDVRIVREGLGRDTARLKPVPIDSVRMLETFGGPNCAPMRILARLHVRGRLFAPSDAAVRRALRRAAGSIGANAIAYTLPSMEDLPVPGLLDKIWDDGDDPGALRYRESRAGRAAAIRCHAR
ncbi:MAG TPA: hypothetical protein VFM23_09905 [Gemmatimonadales bacterium]|nr:hypothetical protein [Gemmatimonadales bacterium]